MFDCFFGWPKASRCKKLIRKLQNRLKLLKNKRQAIVRQSRDDAAQLIKIGYQDLAFKRAEHICNDETVVELYELLEKFSEFTVSRLSYIRRNKDCPSDINEAVSSLIFASARCGEIPELRRIRKLFSERYGQRFEATALNLLPGNLVNFQVKEKLSIESVPDDTKMELLQEIAKDYCLQPQILAIEFASEFDQQIARQNPSPESYQDDTISTTISSSFNELELEPLANSFKAVGANESRTKGRKTESSSSESLPQIQDESIVYLDDIEEVKHCNERDGGLQDRSVFKFKSPVKLQKDIKDGFKYDSRSDSDSSGKTIIKEADRKREKRRSLSRDNFSVRDLQCMIYYDKPGKNSEKRRKDPCPMGESNMEMESYRFPARFRKRRGSCDLKREEKPLRAISMPQERSNESHSDNVQRSVSFPVASPSHVHPKLPDYEAIAAKFRALKKEYKQNKLN